MAETGKVYKNDQQIGVAADLGTGGALGWEWWAVASGTVTAQTAPKMTANLFYSFATLMQVAGSIKAYGELSSGTFLPVGLNVTATTPAVATVDVMPGPKITYDSVKLEMTTNNAVLSKLRIKLSDAEARQTVAEAKAALTQAKKMETALGSGAFKAEVTQLVRM